jgi:hypothetical protein
MNMDDISGIRDRRAPGNGESPAADGTFAYVVHAADEPPASVMFYSDPIDQNRLHVDAVIDLPENRTELGNVMLLGGLGLAALGAWLIWSNGQGTREPQTPPAPQSW